ncbi:hypothetical protein ACFVT6_26175 [Streptomyces sp. NPDC058049]|uniref:hypothetical protein n=1 Tax=Streptomyces sp. NPDC058049 TaxID=3346314 RepID=UPI0036E6F366
MSTTTRDEILAGEQRAVDHAYDCSTTKLAELSGTSAATASASGKDVIANQAEAQARSEAYGGLDDKSPHLPWPTVYGHLNQTQGLPLPQEDEDHQA